MHDHRRRPVSMAAYGPGIAEPVLFMTLLLQSRIRCYDIYKYKVGGQKPLRRALIERGGSSEA
jgi:hypothetical protein